MEERVQKASLMNSKGLQALENVKRQQRRLELNSVKNFKENMLEIQERRQKAIQAETGIAKKGMKEFQVRERAAIVRQTEDRTAADQEIVESLYSLEVKLQVG